MVRIWKEGFLAYFKVLRQIWLREGEKRHGKLHSRKLAAQYKFETRATANTFSGIAGTCHCSLKLQIKKTIKVRMYPFAARWFLHAPPGFAVIIIIIIRHQSSLDRLSACLIVSLKVFNVVFVQSVYNSALFLPPCCCPLLLHVAANLICIFLVSRQLALLSDLPKFLHYFWGENGCTRLFFWKNFICIGVNLLYTFARGSKFRFHIEEWEEPVHYKP